MHKKEIYYRSHDGISRIHAYVWIPDENTPLRGVIQIVHGMVEYIGRYDRFARYLSSNGFVVAGNDHLGHGLSVAEGGTRGYFAEPDGNECVLRDIHSLHNIMRVRYPELPYFILGHSMGSFLTRQYIGRYAGYLAGAVIMGTGTIPPAVLDFGIMLCRAEARLHGWKYVSRAVIDISSASNNKRIPDAKTPSDWLSTDEEIVRAFCADPLCGFSFTVNGYYNMFRSIRDCQSKRRIRLIPKDLPLLLVSGKEDPIGNYGDGVWKAYRAYVNAGIREVSYKLYPGDRHEILNEKDREQVYEDLLEWFLERC